MKSRYAILLFIIYLPWAILLSSPLSAGICRWSSDGPLRGWINHIVIDPNDPSILYFATNVGIYKSTDTGATAQFIHVQDVPQENNPSIILHPDDSRIVYALYYQGYGENRKLLKSNDSAGSWECVSDDVPVHSLVINYAEPSIFYGTSDSLYMSTNGGTDWNALQVRIDDKSGFTHFTIDPTNHKRLMACTSDKMYVSENGGQQWGPVQTGSLHDIQSLSIDPEHANVMYVTLAPSGTDTFFVYKSSDGGNNWIPVSSGLPRGKVNTFTFDPDDSDIIYVLIAAEGLYRSHDQGTTWRFAAPFESYYSSLSIDPVNTQNMFIGTSFGYWKSADGGISWDYGGVVPMNIHDIEVDPTNSDIVYAASPGDGFHYSRNDGGVFISRSNGNEWDDSYIGGNFECLAINPLNSQEVYAGRTLGVEKSIDGGTSWETTLWLTLDWGATAYSVAIDPVSPSTVYVGAVGQDQSGIHKSTDRGATWEWLKGEREAIGLIVHPNQTNILYGIFYHYNEYSALTHYTVKKSTDGGTNWTLRNTGLENVSTLSVALDPVHPETLYTGTKSSGVFKSIDGGESWTPVNKYLPDLDSLRVSEISVYPQNPNIIYAATARGVFKSFDGGENWYELNEGLTQQDVNCLAVDVRETPTVYAGTPEGLFAYSDTHTVFNPLTHDIKLYSPTAQDIETPNRYPFTPTIMAGNLGTAEEANVDVYCYIIDTTSAESYFNVQHIENVAVNDTITIFFDQWFPQRAEVYYGIFMAHPQSDEDTTNNIWTVTIRVLNYTDVRTAAGLSDDEYVENVAWIDFDNDADFDLITSQLYQNDGEGFFLNITGGVGLQNMLGTNGIGIGDFNNDGATDIYVESSTDREDKLLQNIDGQTFRDVTLLTGINTPWPTHDVDFIDFNNDGHLDIFITNAGRDGQYRLYRNDGAYSFADVTGTTGIMMTSASGNSIIGDYNNDGNIDIVTLSAGVQLYLNDGDGTFTEVGDNAGLDISGTGWHSATSGDYNNDGLLDLYFVCRWEPNALYRNNGDGTFRNVTIEAGLSDVPIDEDAIFIDVDNDGFLDLFGTNEWETHGNPNVNILYCNNGDGSFIDRTHTVGRSGYAYPRSIAAADFNGDGYVDIAEPHILLRNNGGENNWLHIQLIGILSNTSAIGARVRAVAGDLSQIREVTSDGGQSLTVEFGLGTAAIVDSIIINWPSGITQKKTDVAANQRLEMVEIVPLEMRGDVNRDGRIDLQDILLIVNMTLKLTESTLFQSTVADLNGDNRIDVLDIVMLIQNILGNEDPLPQ